MTIAGMQLFKVRHERVNIIIVNCDWFSERIAVRIPSVQPCCETEISFSGFTRFTLSGYLLFDSTDK